MVILVFNILVACIPIGYIVFLRVANSNQAVDIVYAESRKALYWPMGEYESTTNWFEMDGTKYVCFREGFSNETFYLCSTEDKRGEPIANISYDPANSNAFNDAMTFLLTGSSREKLRMATIYPLINENGFEFYEVSGNVGNGVFCRKPSLIQLKPIMRISPVTTQKTSPANIAFIRRKKAVAGGAIRRILILKKISLLSLEFLRSFVKYWVWGKAL